MQGVPSNIATS